MTIEELTKKATIIAGAVVKATRIRNTLATKKNPSDQEKVLKKNIEGTIKKLISEHERLLDQIGYLKREAREKELHENTLPNGTLSYKPFAKLLGG